VTYEDFCSKIETHRADNNQVNKGHSLLRTAYERLRHSVTIPAPQTAPITKGVMQRGQCYSQPSIDISYIVYILILVCGLFTNINDYRRA